MAELQPWERILQQNRMAEQLQHKAYPTEAERWQGPREGGLADQVNADLAKLTTELEAEQQKRIAVETELAWLRKEVMALVSRVQQVEKAIGSLALDVAALNGADSEVVRPGNGIDRPDEYVPGKYADQQHE